MQFRHIFPLLLTGLLLFTAETLLAQKVTTNENGDKIISYPDGSWRYFDSEEDSRDGLPTVTSSEKDNSKIIGIYRAELIKAAERAVANRIAAAENYEDIQFDRVLIGDELKDAEDSDDATKSEINEIKARLREAMEKEKEALEILNNASNAANAAKRKSELSDDEVYQLLIAKKQTDSLADNADNRNQANEANSRSNKVFAAFNPKDDLMKYPPEKNCHLVFDGVDDFSGKARREVAKSTLFSYTSDEMRPYFKGRDFITCEAYLSALSGGSKFLSLEITIASDHAQRDYGIIEKGSVLSIKLLDGGSVKLFNNKTDVGILDELNKSVTYHAQYIINSGDEKVLRKNEIDKIRFIWSSGYEDYEVYDLDFFFNQFECLNR